MNKQGKNQIEYVHYTWNPLAGCFYGCQWTMPDGGQTICYAKATAEGVAAPAYPHGFEHAYHRPKKITEPLLTKKPSRIFVNSMGDLMGGWNSREQIIEVLDICEQADQHQFLVLTKNPRRLPEFRYPANVWVGLSMPPSRMNHTTLTGEQQVAMLTRGLDYLGQTDAKVKWLSAEPLSWNIAGLVETAPINWLVIGAASNGLDIYPPERAWVDQLHEVCDNRYTPIPVFHKGNVRAVVDKVREDYPCLQNLLIS